MASRGIGLARTDPPVARAAPPSAPPVPAGPTPSRPLAPRLQTEGERIGAPQFQDDPIAALGFVMQEFGAGLTGQELPSTRLRRETLEGKRLELAQLQVGAQALEQGISLLERTPDDQRAGLIDEYAEQFERAMPGLRDMLTEFSQDIPSSKQVLGAVGEFAPELQSFCGADIACIREKATDSTFMEGLQKTRDRTNLPLVGSKLRAITGAMFSNPEALSGIPRDELDDFVMSMTDLQRANESFPEEIKLTPSELRTIERNPQILARFGIKTPEMQEFQTKELFKSRLRIQEKSLDPASAAKSDLIDPSGNVKSEVSNDLRRAAQMMLGAQPNKNTGVMDNLTPAMALKANDISVAAEALLQQGRATGTSQALSMASGGLLPETPVPELAVPPKKRAEVAAQQVTIAQMRPMVESRLDDAVGVGFTAMLKELSTDTLGQAFDAFTFKDNAASRQRLREMNNQIKAALAANAENGKISNQDMNFVLDLLPPTDSWFANKEVAAQQMRQILDFFDEKTAANEAALRGERPETQKPAIDFTWQDVDLTASEEGMTDQQVLESVAESRGLTVDEIRKALGSR